jgi:hypothetical protein
MKGRGAFVGNGEVCGLSFSLIFTCFGSIVSFLALSMCELAGVFVCFVTTLAKVLLACWGEQSASSSLALTFKSKKS